jgi:hypothetical protein
VHALRQLKQGLSTRRRQESQAQLKHHAAISVWDDVITEKRHGLA